MPAIALRLRIRTTAVRDPQTVRLPINLRANNDDLNDFVGITLTVTRELADAVASPWRIIGISIEMDDGDGLRTLTRGEVGPLTISGSLENYGRTMQFTRSLPAGSPFRSDLLRGLRRIRATAYIGASPATIQARVLFDGYLHSATFGAFPPTAEITAQDASILYAEKRLALDIAEGDGRSREEIGAELLGASGIPVYALNFGAAGGGQVKKAMQVGGDQNLLEWFRGYISPTGTRMQFNRSGELVVGAFDETGVVVRQLGVSDINNLRITPPGTVDANEVRMSGTGVTLVAAASNGGENGDGSITGAVVTSEVVTGDNQPQVAVKVQDHQTGTISDVAIPPATRSAVVSATTTAVSIEISTDKQTVVVHEIVDTYGFYAQRAAQFHIVNGAGDLDYNTVFDVYLFSDGSARAVTTETYQHLTRTETTKTYLGGTLRQHVVTAGRWDPDAVSPYASGSFSSGTGVLVTAQREWWLAGGGFGGKDAYFDPVSKTITTYDVAPDGIHLVSIFEVVNRLLPGSAGTSFSGFTYQNTGDPATGQAAETMQSSLHAEQIANLEQTVGDPQTLTAVAVDVARQGLTTRVVSQQQNDFCESVAELARAAFYALRELSRFTVEFDMAIDATLEEGTVFTLPVPIVGADDEPIVVGAINLQFNGIFSENTQHVTGWYYPPNLRIQ